MPEPARQLIASEDFFGRSTDGLARWLRSAPELAGRLLRWCNTSLLGGGAPFEDLDQAAAALEAKLLSRLAVLAHVREWYLPEARIDRFSRERLWGHSVAVAAVAQMIARTCLETDTSMVFLAGGLHDIGLCASERVHGAAFGALVADVDELSPIHEIEQERLGWDHASFGGQILRHWGLPEAIVAAARHHHDPLPAMAGPHAATVSCVALANHLCSRTGWSAMGVHSVPPPPGEALAPLRLTAEVLGQLWEQLPAVLRGAGELR